MKVTLINHTQDARELLLYTKATRLSQSADLMEEIKAWPEEKKQKELDYMLKTIQSSWEFCNYVFSIEGVSRAFTHQLVRTRDADIPDEEYSGPRHKKLYSAAQQSQRTVDMSGFGFVMPEAVKDSDEALRCIQVSVAGAQEDYTYLTEIGVAPQDARSILPTNIETNIIIQLNLRTLSEMAKLRLCTRTQGEYQQVFRQMRNAIIAVHPWAEPFLRVYCASTGVCCFPNYTECPIKPGMFDPHTGLVHIGAPSVEREVMLMVSGEGQPTRNRDNEGWWVRPLTKEEIQERWEKTNYEAVPQHNPRNG